MALPSGGERATCFMCHDSHDLVTISILPLVGCPPPFPRRLSGTPTGREHNGGILYREVCTQDLQDLP